MTELYRRHEVEKIGKLYALIGFILGCASILGFVFSYNLAFASYTAFDGTFATGTADTSVFVSLGLDEGMRIDVGFVASSSFQDLRQVIASFCNNGDSVGRIDLEIRHLATTSDIVASSTKNISELNTTNCGASGNLENDNEAIFELNNYVAGTSILPVWLSFYGRGGHAGTVYTKGKNVTLTYPDFGFYRDNVLIYPTVFGNYYSFYTKGISDGEGPRPSLEIDYNASTTGVACQTFDIGCYFSNALSWAFIPSSTVFDKYIQLKDDIKNKPPFGYFTSAYDALFAFSSTSAPAFALASSSPITALVFTPLRTGLSWLILIAGLYWLYKRLTDITI
jgi:hypothetical protein